LRISTSARRHLPRMQRDSGAGEPNPAHPSRWPNLAGPHWPIRRELYTRKPLRASFGTRLRAFGPCGRWQRQTHLLHRPGRRRTRSSNRDFASMLEEMGVSESGVLICRKRLI